MREIVLDTETTGLEPHQGHRVVEIGAVELINRLPSGRTYHQYVNPERDMPEGAYRVHGLSSEFLADKPVFAEIANAFLDFCEDSPLVIHNAAFDMKFLNAELEWAGRPALPSSRAIDTLAMAKKRFPGAPANLDALCKRFDVDRSARTLHGALLDSRLLGEVYLHLTGGRQTGLELTTIAARKAAASGARRARRARPHRPSEAELARHAAFVAGMKDPIWAVASVRGDQNR